MFSSNATQVSAVTQAEAVDFDGTNDYLRRTSDLTGNTTSKTFTFSTWIWQGNTSTSYMYVVSDGTNQRFVVSVLSNGTLKVEGTANTNSVILSVTAPLANAPRLNTFYHVLISMDMANAANRSIYINDVAQTLTVTTYTNAAIPFNQVDHVIAGTQGGSAGDLGRLSNVFLDYTYRDMSVTANRRLFITADLKPAAGQAALNPILYFKMDDPTTVATNSGTGGNFTLTGTIARSGRGPNQYNAPYSTFDGTNGFLYRSTAPTGAANSTQFTFAYNIQRIGTTERVLVITSNLIGQQIWFNSNLTASTLNVSASDSSNTVVLGMSYNPAGGFVVGRNYNVVISLNLASTSTRRVFVNGVDVTSSVSFSTYTNSAIGFGSTTYWSVASRVNTDWPSGNGSSNAYFGALWFNTSYIDLSVASNLAKFVSGTGIDAKPVDLGATGELPTGTSPLIYLPMYGNNAGKNYGTGGDFTVNSGPYTGARGPNEFWGNKAYFANSYLTLSSTFGWGSTNKFTCSFWIKNITNALGQQNIFYLGDSGSAYFSARLDASNRVEFWAADSGGTMILSVRSNTTIPTGSSAYVQACFDLSSTAKRFIYINGTNSLTSTTYTNTSTPAFNFARIGDGSYADYQLSEVYLLPSYIDFSVEANRLNFRDAFGNPANLPSAITALSVTNPPIYMRFPPTSFGTNSGTGGAFTVTGTITDGGQL